MDMCMQIDYMVFGLKDIKLVGCSKNHVLIYLQMSAMKLKTILVLVIVDTSVIKSNYYMVGHY